jgi:hypothetical protein
VRVIASPKLAFGGDMTGYVAGLRSIFLAGLRTVGRQRASIEVAALRRLAMGRRTASMDMLRRRGTSSPSVPGEPFIARPPVPRDPLKQEK